MKVTAKTIIGDIVKMGPKATNILMRHGMMCIGCPSSQRESLEEAALTHEIDSDTLIQALNSI